LKPGESLAETKTYQKHRPLDEGGAKRSEGYTYGLPWETEGLWVLGFRGFWGRPWAGLVDQSFWSFRGGLGRGQLVEERRGQEAVERDGGFGYRVGIWLGERSGASGEVLAKLTVGFGRELEGPGSAG
jgi:hypothetical protein